MKKKALRKDFYMEIRRSKGRFLSIFFIVAIGCAFFSGIRSSEPDMRYSGDAYFDEKNLMDVRVISTMGLTDDDLDAIKETDGVKAAEGRYSVDALCAQGENQIVVHVMSLLPTLNQVQLEEGRLPKEADECVVDIDFLNNSDLEIGDTVTFSGGDGEAITDSLTADTFKVTGAVSSPEYISFQRGSTTIGTGTVEAFVCVPEESFVLDVYTEINVRVEGAESLTAFTDEYDACVSEVKDNLENIRGEREQARYDQIVTDAEGELEKAGKELNDAQKELEEGKVQAETELADARRKLEEAQTELQDGKNQLESSRQQLESSRQQLITKEEELKQAAAELNGNIETLNTQIDQLNAAKEQYNALAATGRTDDVTLAALEKMYSEIQNAEYAVSQAQGQIETAKTQIEYGQQQLAIGWDQIVSGEQQIAGAEADILSGEQEISEGWTEYYKGKDEAEKEISEGEQKLSDAAKKLDDAQKEIEEIEMPEWYVYDRSCLPDYSGYGENSDRMRAIGEVFPAIFFLVAALISLTTMTRMVEEQRTMIGTLKALGYDRISIAGKYLGYALLATVAGSAVGVLAGEKIFPYIIITAYGIMYQHMNELRLPYNLIYGVGAAAAALASTLAATLFACISELREQAAQLMRPPSPKQGQRVLLERISFIWKRLNFSWKASVRNLVRYKKRFLMTVFGIGGCMGLMLVGFGLKDSIFAIVDIQYDEIQLYDGTVIMKEGATGEERENIAETLLKDEVVAGTEEGLLTQVTLKNGDEEHEVYLDVPKNTENFSDYTVLRDRVSKEKYQLDNSGAVITEKIAKELGAESGDTIVVSDEEGEKEITISSVCENYMGHYLYMTPELYRKVYGHEPEFNSVFYKTVDRITEEAERVGEEALGMPGALSVSYTTDLKEQVDHMLGALDLVIIVLIISAGMLAFVVLYNLNNIAITERKRELATLKVLGFYNKEVTIYVYRENIVLTLFGSIFGMLLGWILHRFIIVTVEIDSVMFGRIIDVSSYIYSFLLTAFFSALVNGAMYFKLKKIDMVESLKSVE